MSDWHWKDALTDPPVCVCNARDYEHGHRPQDGCAPYRKPPLGGLPIWDADGRMIGQHPAPPPRTMEETQ